MFLPHSSFAGIECTPAIAGFGLDESACFLKILGRTMGYNEVQWSIWEKFFQEIEKMQHAITKRIGGSCDGRKKRKQIAFFKENCGRINGSRTS